MKQVRLTYARDIAKNGGQDLVTVSDAHAEMYALNRRGVVVGDAPQTAPPAAADIPAESPPAAEPEAPAAPGPQPEPEPSAEPEPEPAEEATEETVTAEPATETV